MRVDSPPPAVRVLPALIALSLAALVACGGTTKRSGLPATGTRAPCSLAPGSALHRAANLSVDRNVAYGSDGGRPLLLDVYRPAGNGPLRPAVLVVHGGGWAGGDKSDYAPWSTALAKSGFVAFDANYTLSAPNRPGWPLQLQELRAAVRWIRAHANAYDIDPKRIGALGGSAGGNLVELLGDDSGGPCTGGDRVAAVAAWSGPTNLAELNTGAAACLRGTRACGSVGLASLLPALLERYVGCSVAACPQTWADASPSDHVSGGASPMLLINSAHEVVPLSQVQAFAAALAAANVPHTLVVYPGGAHAEVYGAQAVAPTAAFLARYLEGS